MSILISEKYGKEPPFGKWHLDKSRSFNEDLFKAVYNYKGDISKIDGISLIKRILGVVGDRDFMEEISVDPTFIVYEPKKSRDPKKDFYLKKEEQKMRGRKIRFQGKKKIWLSGSEFEDLKEGRTAVNGSISLDLLVKELLVYIREDTYSMEEPVPTGPSINETYQIIKDIESILEDEESYKKKISKDEL